MFPCPHLRLRIWSRDTGLAVPSRVSLVIFRTQRLNLGLIHGIPPTFQSGAIYLYRQPTSSQSRVNHVTQVLTDGVHCLDFAGTGPVAIMVVPVTGAAFSDITIIMDQLIIVSLGGCFLKQKGVYLCSRIQPGRRYPLLFLATK